MKHLKTCLALSFMIFAIGLAGCAVLLVGGAVGAGSVVYIEGQLKEDIAASVPAVHDASLSALKELNLPLIEDSHDKLSAKIESSVANGDKVWIAIESVNAGSSRISIRIGILGNQTKSREILDGIHKYLAGGGGSR